MSVLVDTHVHLWPGHDPAAMLAHLIANLGAAGVEGERAAVLVDGRGCDGFVRLESLPGRRCGRFALQPGADPLTLDVAGPDGPTVLRIFAGRQVVTAERLEVLALGTRKAFPDGEAAGRTIEAVLAAGALPVLAWAPGKWLGGRGRIVASLIRRFHGQPLLLGDTSLRARGWPTPRLMREGEEAGFGCVCGSDPLPPAGEERHAGRFATHMAGNLRAGAPARSLLDLLRSGASATGGLVSAGRRSGPLEMAARLLRHARAEPMPGPSSPSGAAGA